MREGGPITYEARPYTLHPTQTLFNAPPGKKVTHEDDIAAVTKVSTPLNRLPNP